MGPPIRVVATSPREKLDRRSRVNFQRIYTIEHNVKVYDFGRVQREWLCPFIEYFKKVWGIGQTLPIPTGVGVGVKVAYVPSLQSNNQQLDKKTAKQPRGLPPNSVASSPQARSARPEYIQTHSPIEYSSKSQNEPKISSIKLEGPRTSTTAATPAQEAYSYFDACGHGTPTTRRPKASSRLGKRQSCPTLASHSHHDSQSPCSDLGGAIWRTSRTSGAWFPTRDSPIRRILHWPLHGETIHRNSSPRTICECLASSTASHKVAKLRSRSVTTPDVVPGSRDPNLRLAIFHSTLSHPAILTIVTIATILEVLSERIVHACVTLDESLSDLYTPQIVPIRQTASYTDRGSQSSSSRSKHHYPIWRNSGTHNQRV
jgi:hypothetical protein